MTEWVDDDEAAHLKLVYSVSNPSQAEPDGPTLYPSDWFLPDVLDLWNSGLPSGEKTGWRSLDAYYTVAPGQLTIITGWPGAGKSEWLDHLLINLSEKQWKFAIYSAENQPVSLHIAKLMEKLARRPFGEGIHERIPYHNIVDYIHELGTNFQFLSPKLDAVPLYKIIQSAAPFLTAEDGRKPGLVIDPWNELEHARPKHKSETEYISESLSYLRNWARQNGVHVWLVAHPAKQKRDDNHELPVPKPDMISGSQHWWNKADVAIAINRPAVDEGSVYANTVEIHIQKIRFKWVGKTGMITLKYDKITGRYSE